MVQALHDGTDEQVVGPEAVPPLAHAMRLVDDEQAGPALLDLVEHLGVAQLLGSQQEHLDLPGGEGLERLAPGPLAARRADGGRGVAVLAQGLDLVTLQRDGRADHEGRAVEQVAGGLVDGRLAGPGGQDGDRVPHEHRLDGLALAGPEGLDVRGHTGRLRDDVAILVEGGGLDGRHSGGLPLPPAFNPDAPVASVTPPGRTSAGGRDQLAQLLLDGLGRAAAGDRRRVPRRGRPARRRRSPPPPDPAATTSG